LVPCFAGNIALPERQPPADHLELSPNAQGYFTGQPRPNQAQMQTLAAATVEVRYDLSNGTHAEGSGVVVGDRVLTAAHVVYGQQLSKITVVDNNGNSHTVKDGCFVYQRNGERTPLNRTSQDRVTSVNDDLAVLRLNDRVPTAGLTLGNTAGYGEPVFVAGSPVPQNQRSKVFLAGVAVSGRDNTFAATALLGGEQNTAGPGVSGGALVTTDLLLAGIYNSSGTMEGPSLGANFGVSSSATELQIASYTGAEICQAAIAAQQAQVRAS
jgi:hypothetical protein